MRTLVLIGLTLLASACGAAGTPDRDPGATVQAAEAAEAAVVREASAPARVAFSVPDPSSIPDGPLGVSIRRGKAILEATRDSLPLHVGNGLRCTSCHLDGGTRENVMSWVGVYARFPQYRSRSGLVIDLEERVGDCFERSLNGRSPAYDSREMRDIIAYMAWLSRETPVGRQTEGQGMRALAPLPTDTAAGHKVYIAECARCHGDRGQGLAPQEAGGAAPPPLWGPRSYNIGAGMARPRTAAAFIHAAMPHDRPGTLTAQQAYDVAAYVNSRSRPDFADKENDWPNGDPPADVAYWTRAAAKGPGRP